MILSFITIFITIFSGFYVAHFFVDKTHPNAWRIFHYIGDFVSSVVAAINLVIPVFLVYYFLLKNYVPDSIFFPLLFVGLWIVCYLNIRPKPPLNYKREARKRKKQLALLFKQYSPIIPSATIKNSDTSFVKKALASKLTQFDFGNGHKMSEKDSVHFDKLNRFIGIGFGKPYKQISEGGRLHTFLFKAAQTLEIQFISYSPSGKYFICYYTFKHYVSHLKKDIDAARILFGEKTDTEMRLYLYSRLFKEYNVEDEHKYKFFTGWGQYEDIIHNLDKNSLTRKFDYPKCNPMDPLFWKDPNFFSLVKIDGKETVRFKTFNMYGRPKDEFPYELRENLILRNPNTH